MDHLNYFSDCFQELLSENNMSIKQLSESTGIKLSRLYDFVNRLHVPSLENAIKIAEAFQCPLDFLFGFCNDFKPRDYHMNDSVSVRVKQAMDDSKISRYQLHKLTQISQPQLLRWYHGMQTPTLVSLISIAEHLNSSLDYLAGRD